MHILVTRSGTQGVRLVRRLAEAGSAVSHYAPLEPSPVDDPESVRRQLELVLPVDILVAPSVEALRQLDSLVGLSRFAQTLAVVPGPGTASAARRLGLENLAYPEQAGDSEQLLALAHLSEVAGKKILIAAASGGRRLIDQELKRRGAAVHRLLVYSRSPVEPPAGVLTVLRNEPELVTLLASGGALRALQQQLPQDCWLKLTDHPMVAPSRRVARLAEAAGCRCVQTASGADDEAMLVALSQIGASGVPFHTW